MPTEKVKPFQLFFPITRRDEDERIVEGYAYVNEVVPGEGGIRLRREAMEAATPEYLRAGTVRAMHQPIAAGKPLEVTWDAKGAYLRAKIVDDNEWEKVKEGVYKGFSVSVNGLTMRGRDVETCEWWDSSLVDRGKDRDALFSVWRAPGFTPVEEVEVEVLAEAPEIAHQEPGAAEAEVETELARIAVPEGWTPEQIETFRAAWDESLARDYRETLTRLEQSQAELARVQTALAAAEERVKALERSPAPVQSPVRFPAALEREFAANQGLVPDAETTALQEELTRLLSSRPATREEQETAVHRLQVVKMQLAERGVRL